MSNLADIIRSVSITLNQAANEIERLENEVQHLEIEHDKDRDMMTSIANLINQRYNQ